MLRVALWVMVVGACTTDGQTATDDELHATVACSSPEFLAEGITACQAPCADKATNPPHPAPSCAIDSLAPGSHFSDQYYVASSLGSEFEWRGYRGRCFVAHSLTTSDEHVFFATCPN